MYCIVIEEKKTGKSIVEGEFETIEQAEARLEDRKVYYNTPLVLRKLFDSYEAELEFFIDELMHEEE